MRRTLSPIADHMNRITAFGGAALSGICLFLAFAHLVPFLGWVALVPLFFLLDRAAPASPEDPDALPAGNSALPEDPAPLPTRTNRRSRFHLGFVAAATFSIFAFGWMIPGARTFTGASIGYGIAIFAIAVLTYAAACATLLALTPPMLIVPVWIIAETLLQAVATKIPWFLFHIGNALATELIAIQPMSVIGVTGAGFVVLLVNYGLAHALTRRSWKHALAPLLLFCAYLAWGLCLLPPEPQLAPAAGHHEPTKQTRAFPLAIVKENIPPEIPWDSTNGNQRVRQLLQAEDRSIATGAHVLVWSESAIPWTWSPDDDLVKEVLRHSAGHRTSPGSETNPVTHILGMNTAVAEDIVRNSAYCLLPDGRIAGRYDKIAPLLFIEQPALGWQFPFFSSDGYSVEPGDNDNPLPTPDGKAGVLICNESALPDAAAARVKKGAQFLVNMSNDGWFRDTWLVAQHFYNARLRAVETRKDLVINSNNGWSGCVYASGRVDTTGNVFTIHPNDKKTIAVKNPLLPVYVALLFILGIYFINKKTRLL